MPDWIQCTNARLSYAHFKYDYSDELLLSLLPTLRQLQGTNFSEDERNGRTHHILMSLEGLQDSISNDPGADFDAN